MSMVNSYTLAIETALYFHSDQFRKGSGLPYISHPFDVCKLLHTWGFTKEKYLNMWLVGLLHDCIEDARNPDYAKSEIKRFFTQDIYDDIVSLTRDSETDKNVYLFNLMKASPEALIVKCADRICNVGDFYDNGDKKYALKYFNQFMRYYPEYLKVIKEKYPNETSVLEQDFVESELLLNA